LVANDPSGNRADGTADESPFGKFVVLVSDDSTDHRACQATHTDSLAAIGLSLKGGGGDSGNHCQPSEAVESKHRIGSCCWSHRRSQHSLAAPRSHGGLPADFSIPFIVWSSPSTPKKFSVL
jgi:hypothetical protein